MISIRKSDRIFVLTGAGISAESGLRTFRDANGLWEDHRVEDVASPEGYRRDPKLVWRFYSERRAQASTCLPNAGHVALAKLQASLGDRFFLCTQNVDPLHEAAGNVDVLHMHGELAKSRCASWGTRSACGREPFVDDKVYFGELPHCACGEDVRPHICWFGEVPFGMDRIDDELRQSSVFVTIGSSGVVYPAAAFAHAAKSFGAKTYYVGPERPENARAFDEVFLGKGGDVLPSLFEIT